MMQYRREIDGLRALAVVPVILFHAGFSVFSGGFVGVDVFFVISGYLITTILIDDIVNKRFSIWRFYERRARRILPALFFVMLVCIPVAWVLMLPYEFDNFGRSVVAVSLFASNILFWRESGYFAAESEEMPLLHTWSLAVEEQYYVVFPIILVLLWRFGRAPAFWIIMAMSVCSLLISEWGWRNKPSANFYLAPTRAWELFAGSIAAFIVQKHGVRNNEFLAMGGLIAVLVSIFVYDSTTPFPSLYTLLPVGGVVLLVIWGGSKTIAARLLGNRVFVGIGLISYSAYLWHQPLFAFARIWLWEEPSLLLMGMLSLLSLVLAVFSWRFVERPFRRSNPTSMFGSQRAILSASAVGCVLFIAAGFATIAAPTRVELAQPELFTKYHTTPMPATDCAGFAAIRTVQAFCRSYGEGNKTAVIWGDSHTVAFWNVVAPPKDTRIIVISHEGCPPIGGVKRSDIIGNADNCLDLNILQTYQDFVVGLEPDAVVLVARWTLYMRGWMRQGIMQPATHFLTDGQIPDQDATSQTSTDALRAGLKRTLRALDPAALFVVAQAPDMNFMDAHALVFLEQVDSAPIAQWHAVEDAMMDDLRDNLDVTILETRPLFCSQTSCALRRDGYRVYGDDNHLSGYGITFQWGMIRDALLDLN
jgi:peptidoglycan/LPS O-acetylase OafA/YrhL